VSAVAKVHETEFLINCYAKGDAGNRGYPVSPHPGARGPFKNERRAKGLPRENVGEGVLHIISSVENTPRLSDIIDPNVRETGCSGKNTFFAIFHFKTLRGRVRARADSNSQR